MSYWCTYMESHSRKDVAETVSTKVKGKSRTYYYEYFIVPQHVYSTNAVIKRLALLSA